MAARGPNKQLRWTVMDKAPRHVRQRAAAELRRWASVPRLRSAAETVLKAQNMYVRSASSYFERK